jgi:FixJ family two-component response regulator
VFESATTFLESGSLTEIDCLISDIDQPTIDGFELMRQAYAASAKLPVILITGHADILKLWASTSAGHYRLFTKPFDGQELLTAVSDAVRNSQRPIPESC